MDGTGYFMTGTWEMDVELPTLTRLYFILGQLDFFSVNPYFLPLEHA